MEKYDEFVLFILFCSDSVNKLAKSHIVVTEKIHFNGNGKSCVQYVRF